MSVGEGVYGCVGTRDTEGLLGGTPTSSLLTTDPGKVLLHKLCFVRQEDLRRNVSAKRFRVYSRQK